MDPRSLYRQKVSKARAARDRALAAKRRQWKLRQFEIDKRNRQIFALHTQEKLSFVELGQKFDLSPSYVRMVYFAQRAREKYRHSPHREAHTSTMTRYNLAVIQAALLALHGKETSF